MQLAQEEISVYTDRMENLNGVLDHYSTLMDLLGKKQDYSKKN
jgi:hypothetical protein